MDIIKRDGSKEKFSYAKLKRAIMETFRSLDKKTPSIVVDTVGLKIADKFKDAGTISVEQIQDIIEEVLYQFEYKDVAREFILYREKHKNLREWVAKKSDFINKYKKSCNTADATIDDNSNVGSKNIGVLNNEIHKEDNIHISRAMITTKLKELYPVFDSKNYERDLKSHRIYKHDESSFAGAIAPYCCSISMYPFLNEGIRGIGGLSAAPHNLDSYCGMYVNLIFAVSAQFAGAVATSEFLVYFDYFARKEWGDDYYKRADEFCKVGNVLRYLMNKDNFWPKNVTELTEHNFDEDNELKNKLVDSIRGNGSLSNDNTRTIGSQINQYFQQVVYSINQPAAARGMQSAFVNFSYFDKAFFDGMFENFAFPDGTKAQWESVKWLQKKFMTWFNAERLRTVLTFPVESFALVYKDGKFLDQESADFVAAEYARGHSFFTYISDSVDSLSSCCRLKNKIQTKEFNFTNGNMGIMTGSKSVITLNLNRITQDIVKKANIKRDITTWNDDTYKLFKSELKPLLERVYKYHTAYNELLHDMYNSNLLPAYNAGFINLDKQYLTIGLNGLNEAFEFIGGECTDNKYYSRFCQELFSYIKEENLEHKTNKLTFNTECVPAESLAIKNYNWDKEDGYVVPENRNLYASYIYIPSDHKVSVLNKLKMHGGEYIGDYLDGGSAAHINLSEHADEIQYTMLLNYAAKVGCQYFTFNIPNCECADCGFIAKQPFTECPKCGSHHTYLWDRIIGYLTKIDNWSEGRREEQKTRVYSKLN